MPPVHWLGAVLPWHPLLQDPEERAASIWNIAHGLGGGEKHVNNTVLALKASTQERTTSFLLTYHYTTLN